MTRKALLLSSALALAGCAQTTPPPALAPGDVPAAFEQTSSTAAFWPAPDWWRGFGSSELTALEATAQTGNLDIARAHAEKSGLSIDYRGVSAEELAASGATFDIVCAMEVVEHVVDPAAFVGVACSMARPGGLFFAATLNRTLKSFGLAILGAEYILRWAPRGTHQWEKFVTPDELEIAMEDAGAPVVARTGVVYTPVLVAWRLAGDMGVNYMMCGRRED